MQKTSTLFVFALAAIVLAGAAFGGTSVASAKGMPSPGGGQPADWANHDTICSGTLGGGAAVTTINGDVSVQANDSCTLNFVNVTGNVTVHEGASLLVTAYIEPSTISGSVWADKCVSTLLEGNVTVNGDVLITNCTGSNAIGYQGPGVVIGTFDASLVARRSLLGGNFVCYNNAGPCEAWLGRVANDMYVQKNGGAASDVSLNAINGDLHCESNTAAPTHSRGYNWVTGRTEGQCGAGFSTTTTSIGVPESTGMACATLAALSPSGFPVPNVTITSATATAATTTLPARCIVDGSYNVHMSPVNGCTMHDNFQVQLPLSTAWNGRFFMQAENQGSLPAATGANSGSGEPPLITTGFAVADDDRGSLTADMALCGDGIEYQLFEDPGAVISESYQTQQITAIMAKYLIAVYYGQNAKHSYQGGCSGGGQEAMMWSQTFPQYFDAVFAGDPGPDHQTSEPSQLWETEQWLNAYNATEPALPQPPATVPNTNPVLAPQAILYSVLPLADQQLFETVLLQYCDPLDGVADGVIDNQPLCNVKFNPATVTYKSGGVTYPLQCPGPKNATCLSPVQIQAIIADNAGPRSNGHLVYAPMGAVAEDHADNQIFGYLYDAGWGTSPGLFSQGVGTSATTPPGSLTSIKFFVWEDISPIDPPYNPLNFNYNTDLGLLNPISADATVATSLDISKFVDFGHKIIYYHSAGDPQIPVLDTISYYNGMAQQYGGIEEAQKFSRLYLIPNMGHCSGGPATDEFDMTTPLVDWVENGIPPGPIPATGVNFTTAQFGIGTVAGAPDNAPTTRNRILCPYPQEARFTGSTTPDVNGIPVAANPADLAVAANYKCVKPTNPDFLEEIGVKRGEKGDHWGGEESDRF